MYIIPPEEQPIVVNQAKTFSILVKHNEELDESLPISLESSDPEDIKIRTSPVYFKKLSEDKKIGRATFTLEGQKVGAESVIEAHFLNYSNLVLVKVIEPPPPPLPPEGLTFDKPFYHLPINKEKTLVLWLKSNITLSDPILAEIESDHPEIVVKGGGKCRLRATPFPEVYSGQFGVFGRQLQARGKITAKVNGFEPALTQVKVEEHEPPRSGVKLKFEPVEEDYGTTRYKWDDKDPYLLKIGAKNPTIKKYLGTPTEQGYPGIKSLPYYTVLAEVIAEALAFRILEKFFKREGQDGRLDYASTDAYYHKYFNKFLRIVHETLVTENIAE
ncbi:MAG: hypothetical protein NUV70_07795 [Caldiserica bacterium]|nr:hypothetical protein [Caldisericota bacterium]